MNKKDKFNTKIQKIIKKYRRKIFLNKLKKLIRKIK